MSYRAVQKVLDASFPISSTDQLVLIVIAHHAHDDAGRDSWPRVSTIAREARLPVRSVQRALARLKNLGVLTYESRLGPGGTHRFVIEFSTVEGGDRGSGGGDRGSGGGRPRVIRMINERSSEQDQDHRAGARASHKVLVKLAHDAFDPDPVEHKERLKELAARAGIAYDSSAVHKALGVVLFQRERRKA